MTLDERSPVVIVDAIAAIEALAGRYDLKPSTIIEIEPASGAAGK